jgi:hypothetical protein
MKVRVSELQGEALNWVVEECEQFVEDEFEPSENWADGGPIIEREWLDVTPWPNESDEDMRWQCKQHDSIDCVAFGPTPLVAAMRCYVASKLGNEVEVPDELA